MQVFICLLPRVYLWWTDLDQNLPHKFFCCAVEFLRVFVYIFYFQSFIRIIFYKYFPQSLFVFLALLGTVSSQSRSFNFNEVQLVVFFFSFFLGLCLRKEYVRSHCQQGFPLVVQWLGLYTSTAQGMGLIPGQGTKIPHVPWHGQKLFKNKLSMPLKFQQQDIKKIFKKSHCHYPII